MKTPDHLTPVLDIGPLAGPVLLFGGPYGNAEAAKALFAAAERLNIPKERRICTGDVVAYCAGAQACVDLMRARAGAVVMGNCEESVGFSMDDCGCGFEEGTACDVLAKSWYTHAQTAVNEDAKAWMRALPRIVTFSIGGRRAAVIHGGARDISRFVFESAPENVFEDETEALAPLAADIIIGGHCGLPFAKRFGGVTWLNPGVIGMPANDGTPRTWFAVLEAEGGDPRWTFHALEYDHTGAAAAIRAAGLPEAYAGTLGSGLWPSLEVLPPAERGRTGRAIM
ncbi:MAG: metallophosphoesterase family protein [Rhodospirillales bacterium]